MCINEVFTWIPNRRNQTFFLALTTDNQRHLPVRLMSTDSKHSYVKGGKQHWGKKINQLCIADWLSGIFYGFVYERLPWPRFKCNAVSKLQASNVTKLNCSHYNQQCCLCHNACSLIIMGAIYISLIFICTESLLCWCWETSTGFWLILYPSTKKPQWTKTVYWIFHLFEPQN